MKKRKVKRILAGVLAVSMMAGMPIIVSADQAMVISTEAKAKKPNNAYTPQTTEKTQAIPQEIKKITCGNGADRFDADTHPHYHFLCDRCGSLEDMPMDPIGGLEELAKNFYQGRISGHQTFFYGTCPRCLKKEEEKA